TILVRPRNCRGGVGLPNALGGGGSDSGIRHAVTGADYDAVRVGAFMGYRILAELAGLRVRAGDREGHVRVDDPQWHGYLANVKTDAWRQLSADVPETLDGAAFLARYDGTTDLVTRVDPLRRYAVRTPTAHPIFEHQRVIQWVRE